jgi:predicted dehydrogenase
MTEERKISRRTALASGAGLMVLPSRVLGLGGSTAPNEKLNVGFIGIGSYGARCLRELTSQNIAAVCDVDWRPKPAGSNLVMAADVAANYPQAKRFDDWRVMLHEMDKQLDAVVVCSADHTHAVAAITAMKMGKHVYCEKPLAHSIGEVRAMMAAQKKYSKVAVQTGTQGHASDDCRSMVEWIRDGAIGDVSEVVLFQKPHRGTGPEYYDRLKHVHDDVAVPKEVKWDLWLGPSPERPFNPMYLPLRWRDWADFGTGILGDHGPHYFDVVEWALDLGWPETIEAETDAGYDPRDMWPREATVRYQFPAKGKRPAVKVTWYGFKEPPAPKGWPAGKPLPEGGGMFLGSKGTIVYGPLFMGKPGEPLMYSPQPGAPKEPLVYLLPEDLNKSYKRPDKTIPRPKSNWLEWVEAAKTGKQPSADFLYGGRLTQICLLGDIAIRQKGQILHFDSKKEKFTNSDAANAMFHTPSRPGWGLPT